MQEARRRGIKVLLDGQGGDESLLGYERYYATYFKALVASGDLRRAADEFRLATRHSKLGFMALAAHTSIFAIPWLRRIHWWRRSSVFAPDVWRLVRRPEEIHDFRLGRDSIERLQIAEITRMQMPRLLRYEDRNSMAHGIEARVPFVFPRCIEAAVRLPATAKIMDGYTKFPLRRFAEMRVPSSIAWRRNKIGFEAPTEQWLRQHASIIFAAIRQSPILGAWMNTSVSREAFGPGLLWRMYNIAVWEAQRNVGL